MKRFAIRSKMEEYGHYWNFTAWRHAAPDLLMARPEAERELARLQASLPHDTTLEVVDYIALREQSARWNVAFVEATDANGYGALSRPERLTEAGMALRMEAVAKANAAVAA